MRTFLPALIVLFLIISIDAKTQISLPITSLDTNLYIGATQGSANVSSTGAATYSIPIFVSPGSAGLQPSISIEYNSQAGNGLLGVGWNISGLSSIVRVPKDYYHDGIQTDIQLNDDDKFAWDGMRLVDSTGTYGAEGTTYYTENMNFAKIVSHYTTYFGTTSFTVTTKQGNILSYGATSDSRVEAPARAQAVQWRIDQITDPNGNYMKFYYTENQGESYIDRIEYTGNTAASLAAYNKIQFNYEIRPDKSQFYLAGSSVTLTKRLASIDVVSESITIRRYAFTYKTIDATNTDFEKSRLIAINEIAYPNSSNKRFNPILINWGTDDNTHVTVTPANNTFDENTLPLFGDLNGDGKIDELVLGKPAATQYYTHWYYYEAQGNTYGRLQVTYHTW
jgi:hypothetical protein